MKKIGSLGFNMVYLALGGDSFAKNRRSHRPVWVISRRFLKSQRIVYQLIVKDVQTVVAENFCRELTAEEISKVTDWVADRIPFYDLIYDGIQELIGIDNKDEDEVINV